MALLRGMSDPVKGKIFEIEDDSLTIGRGPDNKLCLSDPSVSTHHCVVERDQSKYTLRDLGSTNGTRLNGQSVTSARLNPKDIIQVGSVNLLFDGQDVVAVTDEERVAPQKVASGPIAVVEEQRTPGAVVSSAFGKKRDSRRIVNAAIYIIAALVIAALVLFVMKLF